MSPGEPIEKREQPRIARRLPVQFGTAGHMRGGIAVNISQGGLRVAAADIFPMHTLLDVLVQFPGRAVRLRARVTWTGASGEPGGGRAMGLVFTRPEPSLADAYKEWLEEVKQAMGGGPEKPAGPAADSPRAEAGPPEPSGPVKRRLESPQGCSYEVILEPLAAAGWRLTIIQTPRQLGIDGIDHGGNYPNYAAAEAAMREFVRSH